MKKISAREFLDRYVSAYGESWEDTFSMLIEHPPCAKRMAEFIDDVERYGQQSPVFVDPDGMVSEGHKVAVALAILDEEVNYMTSNPPEPSAGQVWVVEFELDEEVDEKWAGHLFDYLSFRVESDWVYPLEIDMTDNEIAVAMYCRSGQYTADRLPMFIEDRIKRLSGVSISAVTIVAHDRVDGEAS